MKKTILALSLSLTFAISTFAGNTPIVGFAGCPGGLYYPDEQICCPPNQECPVGRSASGPSIITKDSILVELITMFKDIYF